MNMVSETTKTDQQPSLADLEIMHDYLAGYTISSAIYVAAKLGIADALIHEPKSSASLADMLSVNESALYRLMRALASVGIFKESTDQMFELTTLAATMRSDTPNSLRALMIMCGSPWHWQTWGGLLHTVQTGTPYFVEHFKQNFFPYIKENPEVSREFNAAMTSLSSVNDYAIARSYDFSSARKIIDIGGGQGGLLSAILKLHARTQGVLYDLPEVIASATSTLEQKDLRNRVDMIAGDFFQVIPPEGDLYIIKHVLHGLNQDQSIALLKNVAAVLPDKGKLLIIEMVIPSGNQSSYSKFNDLEMMLLSSTGRERTMDEFENIISSCNLKRSTLINMPMGVSIIECSHNNI